MAGHSKSRADKHRKRKFTRRNAETTAAHRLKIAASQPPAGPPSLSERGQG
jgi:hypothetical protein